MGAFRDAATGELQRIQIRHPDDLTELKTLAGAGTQVALRVYRPTTGVRDFFVSFKAPGVVTRTYERSGRSAPGAEPEGEPEAAMESRSATFTEDTTGEAAAMLGGGGGDAGAAPVMRQPGQPVQPGVQPVQPGRPSLQPGRPSLQPGRPAPRPAQPGVQPGQPGGESASDLLGQ
jgi:hypothetical protein